MRVHKKISAYNNPLVNKAPLCRFCGAKTIYFNEPEDISEEITEDIEE